MKVFIQVENLKIELTASNEKEVKAMLFDICEADEIVTEIVGKNKNELMLKDVFNYD